MAARPPRVFPLKGPSIRSGLLGSAATQGHRPLDVLRLRRASSRDGAHGVRHPAEDVHGRREAASRQPARGARNAEALTLHSILCHLDELERQMKIPVTILNPAFLVFVQFVAPRFDFSQKPLIWPVDQQVGPS